MMRASLLVLGMSFLLGCPPSEKVEKKEPSAACTKIGQTCEVAPGKLGTCVTKEGCTEASAACFVCQSQH